MRGTLVIFFLLLASLVAGCRSREPVESLPNAPDTLRAAGERLGQALSESRLTSAVQDGQEVLSLLNARERDALARGYLRFLVSVPVVVEVAAPAASVPYWLEDQAFERSDIRLENPDSRWVVYRKRFPAGWVGLGVNGLDRTARAHYVVFVHARDGDPPLSRDAIRFAPENQSHWRIVEALPGVSAASDHARPFAALPRPLAGSILLQPAHDQRHATLLASGRVWKTHVPSSDSADQVTISFGADPAHNLVWSWRTRPEVRETALRIMPARYEGADSHGEPDPDLSGMRVVPGTSTLIRTPSVLNDPVVRRHVVAMTDLSPDTTYLYSLSDGSPRGWGPWRTVQTGRTRSGRVEFLYMGDAQTGLEAWGQRLRAAFRRHPGIEFILLAGDLVDRGNERTNWDHFFLRSQEVFERIPIMPCAGNHEYLDQGPRLYRSFFRLPDNGPEGIDPGLVYQFETGSVFVAVLDSTLAVSDPGLARLQARWLDRALARTRATWKLVVFHHPVYPSHPWRDSPALREYWVPVFDKHHVDLVLQGHDHAYLRTRPMRGNAPASSPEEGTVYVVSVAGDKFCDQPPRDYIEVGFTKTSTYQTIEIDDVANRLTYRAWTDEGQVADRLELTKTKTASVPDVARSGSTLSR